MAEKMSEQELMAALGRGHDQIQRIANEEARSALVKGWAAQGNLMPQKMDLIRKTEEILNQLVRPPNA